MTWNAPGVKFVWTNLQGGVIPSKYIWDPLSAPLYRQLAAVGSCADKQLENCTARQLENYAAGQIDSLSARQLLQRVQIANWTA